MEIRRYLPSKRFSFFVASFLVAGALVGGAALIGSKTTLPQALSAITVQKTNEGVGETDSDGDGLKDWEEGVRGSDPHKTDSDNDNTPDGEEIKLGRNPAKAGPDDSLIDDAAARFAAEFIAAASSTNLTESASRTLFAKYMAERGKNGAVDLQTQQDLIAQSVSGADVPLRGIFYKQSDLTIVADTAAAMHAFGNSVMQTMHLYPAANLDATITAFEVIIDQGNAELGAAQLRRIGSDYRAMARALLKIPVPKSYAGVYLDAIISLEQAGSTFEDMEHLADDPVRATGGLHNYNTFLTLAADRFIRIGATLRNSGVSFKQSEPGFEWYDLLQYSNFAS